MAIVNNAPSGRELSEAHIRSSANESVGATLDVVVVTAWSWHAFVLGGCNKRTAADGRRVRPLAPWQPESPG